MRAIRGSSPTARVTMPVIPSVPRLTASRLWRHRVALITFILLAVPEQVTQVKLLVWIFIMRIMMIVASGLSYFLNQAIARRRFEHAGPWILSSRSHHWSG